MERIVKMVQMINQVKRGVKRVGIIVSLFKKGAKG